MIKKALIGIIAGIVSGLFSTGGGLIILPALVHLFKIDQKEARATSIFIILPIVLISGFYYYKNNFINWNLGIKCAIGGIIGAILGTKLLNKTSDDILKEIYILFLLYVSVKMII